MSNSKKIAVVVICGGLVWGLSYCGSLYTQFALVFSSFAGGIAALCGILTGFAGE